MEMISHMQFYWSSFFITHVHADIYTHAHTILLYQHTLICISSAFHHSFVQFYASLGPVVCCQWQHVVAQLSCGNEIYALTPHAHSLTQTGTQLHTLTHSHRHLITHPLQFICMRFCFICKWQVPQYDKLTNICAIATTIKKWSCGGKLCCTTKLKRQRNYSESFTAWKKFVINLINAQHRVKKTCLSSLGSFHFAIAGIVLLKKSRLGSMKLIKGILMGSVESIAFMKLYKKRFRNIKWRTNSMNLLVKVERA